MPRTRVAAINGQERVTSVVLENLDTGERTTVSCDTVVTTGDWIPDHELVRLAGITLDKATLGPVVDAGLQTQTPGVFAIGNLVHPVDTADSAALDGQHVVAAVQAHLTGPTSAAGPTEIAGQVEVTAAGPFRWVTPQRMAPGAATPRGDLLLWTDGLKRFPVIRVTQGGHVLARQRVAWPAAPGRIFRVPSHVISTAVVGGGPVILDLE